MKSIKEIRATISARLDEIEAKSVAAIAQFDLSKTEVNARLDQQEKSLLEAADENYQKTEEKI